ncbi:MAG: ATP synthase F1 subunit delta [Clostridia bacterium]|nr:ATP synthase F1 subunit delta [Clostridia bacterium]
MTEMSKAYGMALYGLAKENKQEKSYAEALKLVLTLFSENPEYVELLATPSISKEERAQIIEDALGKCVPEHILSFLKLLCERGRIRQLAECAEEFNRLLDEDMRVSVAKVVSSVELTPEEKKRLKARLEKMSGRRVTLECRVDKTLLGGMVVEMDGRVINGSLRHRLDEMKDVMSR